MAEQTELDRVYDHNRRLCKENEQLREIIETLRRTVRYADRDAAGLREQLQRRQDQ